MLQDIDSLHIAFVQDVDKDWGRWITVNPKHCDYQSSIALTLVIVTNTPRLYGDKIKRMNLFLYTWNCVSVGCVIYTLSYVEIMLS